MIKSLLFFLFLALPHSKAENIRRRVLRAQGKNVVESAVTLGALDSSLPSSNQYLDEAINDKTKQEGEGVTTDAIARDIISGSFNDHPEVFIDSGRKRRMMDGSRLGAVLGGMTFMAILLGSAYYGRRRGHLQVCCERS